MHVSSAGNNFHIHMTHNGLADQLFSVTKFSPNSLCGFHKGWRVCLHFARVGSGAAVRRDVRIPGAQRRRNVAVRVRSKGAANGDGGVSRSPSSSLSLFPSLSVSLRPAPLHVSLFAQPCRRLISRLLSEATMRV